MMSFCQKIDTYYSCFCIKWFEGCQNKTNCGALEEIKVKYIKYGDFSYYWVTKYFLNKLKFSLTLLHTLLYSRLNKC